MNEGEVVSKAIKEAMAEGYQPDGINYVTNFKPTVRNGQAWVRWFNDDGKEVIQDLEHVIYSHSFAKALWGEDEHGQEDYYSPKHSDCSGSAWFKDWEYHLREMVIADDPIAYLKENI